RTKVYIRAALLAVVAAAVAMVLVNNRNHTARIWFFWLTDETAEINVVWLLLVTAGTALVCWWALSLGVGLVREMREVRRLDAARAKEAELERREAELREREQRVDSKVKRAISASREPES
ncbi:MAG: hypothetical protein ACE5E6_07120, partial [Phycisphaerae bacterium]